MALEGAGDGSRGCTVYTFVGVPQCTQHVLHDLRKGPQTWKTGKKVIEDKLKSFNEPTIFDDLCIIGTGRSFGHY